MPYMFISGSFNGDTRIGGKHADPQLMAELGGKKGTITQIYTTPWTAQEALNRLDIRGWKVVSSSAFPNGELAWTLYKDAPPVVLSTPTAVPLVPVAPSVAPPTYSEKSAPP